MVNIWFTRNKVFFDNIAPDVLNAKKRITRMVKDCEIRLRGYTNKYDYDLQVLHFFDIQYRKMKITKIIECHFTLADENTTLLCCDGASRGNLGNSGYGFIIRDHTGQFIAAESGGLGVTTNFVAEIMGTLCALEWAVKHNNLQVIVNTDSNAAMSVFSNNKLPWFVWARWKLGCKTLRKIHFNHVYREINFSADFFAKKECHLLRGKVLQFSSRPINMQRTEFPGLPYFRFA
ncbi:uncharacterized protein LOC113273196 [Papaver somniferum]|uniref:uncharacterized protein LOC113273196 n=1 Tax=Papaver somniferum TaxID=3469 RepID=UPI000E6F80A3|nr:uncharacterized protein LOC113273196 [Papaver somniferum]